MRICMGREVQSLFDQFIHQYGKRLYGFCLTLCTNTADAEDLYQETWLKALDHFSQYRADQDFEPWLTAICVNTYRSSWRRLKRSPIFSGFRNNLEKDSVMERVAMPEKEDYSDLHRAIEMLPEKLRITVVLFYFEEMDIASVSEILEIPSGTVKSRLNKARKRLREVMTDETDLSF